MGLGNLKDIVAGIKQENESFEQRFLREYNAALLKNDMEWEQKIPQTHFRPSSLGGCKRMLYFLRKGYEQEQKDLNDEWTYNLIGICDSGTDRHERIQRIIAMMPGVEMLRIDDLVKEAQQAGVNTEFVSMNATGLEGRCKNDDLHIFFQPDGAMRFMSKEALLEVKTASIYKFKNLTAPLPEHLVQATAYAMGLNLRYVLFFYEDRNFTTHKLFLVEITDEMKEALKEKIDLVEEALELDILPDKEEDKCTYCRFKGLCKAVELPDEMQFDVPDLF